jgi:hypothetical protein
MDDVAYDDHREMLQESIERDAEELRHAVHELTAAARVRFDLGARIMQSPLAWLLGGFLFGVWLGSRHGRQLIPPK